MRISKVLKCNSNFLVMLLIQAVTTDLPVLTFPTFLPPDVELLREPVAREMAARIQHVPVQVREHTF